MHDSTEHSRCGLRRGRLTLAQLAELAGLSPRTIRFYISRGLVPPPMKAGRDAFYTEEHLNCIETIKAGQEKGLTLSEIGLMLASARPEAHSLPEPEQWLKYELSDDLHVYIRSGTGPWRLRKLKNIVAELRQKVEQLEEEEGGAPC